MPEFRCSSEKANLCPQRTQHPPATAVSDCRRERFPGRDSKNLGWLIAGLLVLFPCSGGLAPVAVGAQTVRIATFNVSLYATHAGELRDEIRGGNHPQAQALAEIIQRVRPDILLLNEFDYEPSGELLEVFRREYLAVASEFSGASPPAQSINFEYQFIAPVNTGVPSGFDLNNDGVIAAQPGSESFGNDCWGFGRYEGQYGMAVLSRFPIDARAVRTFRKFRWRDMPDALLPDDPTTERGQDWYSEEILVQFPLSSKSHWDVPIRVGTKKLHVLASHPTPPTFDGAEDRNGRRNHDEIRFWVDYVSPSRSEYIYDDQQQRGGLEPGSSFVILGDLNGDPHDGQGSAGVRLLLACPEVTDSPAPESLGAPEQANLQGAANRSHRGDPRYDTLDAADRDGPGNLRVDYVLPSRDLKIVASGVFWPENKEALSKLTGTFPFPSSDHRLVWVDVEL